MKEKNVLKKEIGEPGIRRLNRRTRDGVLIGKRLCSPSPCADNRMKRGIRG
jgi:hypothetical protein